MPKNQNYDWYIKEANVENLEGEWIAIENKKVVAHDIHLKKVLDQINKSWPNAAITKVPKKGQVMVL